MLGLLYLSLPFLIPVDSDATGIGQVRPGEAFDQRGLACPVLTYEPHHVPPGYVEAHVPQLERTEGLVQPPDLDCVVQFNHSRTVCQPSQSAHPSRCRRAWRPPQPCGCCPPPASGWPRAAVPDPGRPRSFPCRRPSR